MKNYTKPIIEVVSLNNEDIITRSAGIVLTNNTNFTASTKGYNVIDNF